MPSGLVRDLGHVAIMPGLVNAHTHLELSWLRGRVPPAATFHAWISRLMVTRGGRRERADDPKVTDAAAAAVREAREFGTALIGDISNSLASVGPLGEAGVHSLVFHELLGFNLTHGRSVDETRGMRVTAATACPDRVRITVAPHAPYSVSPELFRAIRDEVDRCETPITSIHLGESDSEVEFLERGTGPIPGMLRLVGSSRDDWTTPGCGPVEYLDRHGFLDERTLVVHGVQLTDDSLARLREIGCTLVTCPRSNQWVGVGVPPIARFYASGVAVAIGTDSLASVEDLNVFAELKAMRWIAPSVSARTLLESATLVGARALGFDDRLGSVEPGKLADLIAVAVPEGIADVEEHLVSHVAPLDVSWVRL